MVEGEETYCDEERCEDLDQMDPEDRELAAPNGCLGHASLIADAGFHTVNTLGYLTSDTRWTDPRENGHW